MTVRSGLTDGQRELLDRLNDSELADTFYLAGGTALSTFYLHHRDSLDLDLFARHPFDVKKVIRFLNEAAHDTIVPRRVRDRYEFTVPMRGERIRVEFVHYDYDPLADSGITYKRIRVDSLRDIVANKLSAVVERTEPKDFVDLWFLLRRDDLSIEAGMEDCRTKFGWPGLQYLLQEAFLRPERMTAWPETEPPLDVDELRGFFREASRSLIRLDDEPG